MYTKLRDKSRKTIIFLFSGVHKNWSKDVLIQEIHFNESQTIKPQKLNANPVSAISISGNNAVSTCRTKRKLDNKTGFRVPPRGDSQNAIYVRQRWVHIFYPVHSEVADSSW